MSSFSPDSVYIDDYGYQLPEERIAKFPLERRSASRLLLYNHGNISHTSFEKLIDYTGNNNLMVFNNTRVIQARIIMQKQTGSLIEVFLLEPLNPAEYELAFKSTSGCRWKCMTGNKKKWKGGILEKELLIGTSLVTLFAKMAADHGMWQEIDLKWSDTSFSFAEIIENAGLTPVPPYLNRTPQDSDKIRYQTVYSRNDGSVAAPTAGLHFTKEMLDELRKRGTQTEEITLHVGAGTFHPVKSATINQHTMHSEHFSVGASTLEKLIDHGGIITAVGTTSARTLESLYWLGVKLKCSENRIGIPMELSQWEPASLPQGIPLNSAMDTLLEFLYTEKLTAFEARTQMMIIPGYKFRVIDQLITNFHQPRSTLLLLIAAFIGDDWRKVYDYALANDFRFLSYGDSSLLAP
jgi:S-adenosylmethionine:tRNA ribosyltransferase-isomerase